MQFLFPDIRGTKSGDGDVWGIRALSSGSVIRCATVVARNPGLTGGGCSRRKRSWWFLKASATTDCKLNFPEDPLGSVADSRDVYWEDGGVAWK